MLTFAIVMIIIASILLILIVLAQNPKGGGLSSSFGGGGGQFGGVVQTNKFLDNATKILAGALIVFAVVASLSIPRDEEAEELRMKQSLMREVNQTTIPQIKTDAEVQQLQKQEETPATTSQKEE